MDLLKLSRESRVRHEESGDDPLRADPAGFMRRATGHEPDEWQARLLCSDAERMLVNCHRQAGKSTATSALAIHTALYRPASLVLIISAAQRQSSELFRKVVGTYEGLDKPVPATEDNAVTLALANGSRIVSLPANASTIRGYSAPRLIIVDEAAQVPDEIHAALAPMLLVSRGRLVELSTPYGKRGHFYHAWVAEDPATERIALKATDNPRIDPDFLAGELLRWGPRWYGQEYLGEFHETVDQVFSNEAIDAAFDSEKAPLFAAG